MVEACITATHKKGQTSAIENYRPVSITSVIWEMMEYIVRDHIVRHTSSNRLFADEQHGFVPNRECITNLLLQKSVYKSTWLLSMEEWTEAVEFGYDIDIIYTAFDSIPHKRLAVKLESLGIKGKVLRRIEAFFNRWKTRSISRR